MADWRITKHGAITNCYLDTLSWTAKEMQIVSNSILQQTDLRGGTQFREYTFCYDKLLHRVYLDMFCVFVEAVVFVVAIVQTINHPCSVPTPENDFRSAAIQHMSIRAGIVTSYIKQIPNQPIVFKVIYSFTPEFVR